MKIVIPFIGGPLHGIKFQAEWLPQLNLCIDERDRRIHAYVREEMAYFYEQDLSDKLSANFDVVRDRWPGRKNNLVPVDE